MPKPNWEDFLTNFDQAQDDVTINWGTPRKDEAKQARKDFKKRQAVNDSKFYGAAGSARKATGEASSPGVDKDTADRIKLLEAQLTAPGRTDAERESARRLIEKLKTKGATK